MAEGNRFLPPPLLLILKNLRFDYFVTFNYLVTEVENAASRRDTASLARRTASSAPLAAVSACCAACAAWLAAASAAVAEASALVASASARSLAELIVFMSGPHAVTIAVTATAPRIFTSVFIRAFLQWFK